MSTLKEEAELLIQLAESCILDEKFDEAEEYILQALKIYPSPEVEEAFSLLKQRSEPNETGDEENALRRRKAENTELEKCTRAFTEEQVKVIERIKQAGNYYEILGVSKKATEVEIRQAFKCRSREVHPDKNKAPGSTEAFQAVGTAFAVLIDSEKRQEYDSQGSGCLGMKFETGETFGQNLALLVLGFIGIAGIGALAWRATKSSRASKKN